MRDLAERVHGFEARGVRGWARAADVTAILQRLCPALGYASPAEELRLGLQHDRSCYVRQDVRVAGARSPVWIYRATNRGARLVSEAHHRAHVALAEPAAGVETRMWVPSSAIAALEALRYAAANPAGGREWVPNEPAWRSSRELTKITEWLADAGGKHGTFQPGDLSWLTAAGLVMRHNEGQAVLYRLMPAGEAAHRLEWHGPPPEFTPFPE